MAIDPRRLLEALAGKDVDFIIVGGVAFVLHGSARVTRDLDVCYSRAPENLARLAAALEPLYPTLIYGHMVRVMGLDDLERAKRSAGRIKDLADLAELLEIRRRRGE